MKTLLTASFLVLLVGCSSLPIIEVPSENYDTRIKYLVLHFTSEDFAESLRLLTERTDNRVSVHYLVPEPGDETYKRSSLRVHRLVPEKKRAWHAGRSYWEEAIALNDTSIGIEIVNQSECVNNDPETENPTPEGQTCTLLDYPEEQLALVIELSRDILARNPGIDPEDVIGHGDIATDRRVDPGPLFPWQRLYENGIGAWYDDQTLARYRRQLETYPPDLALLQRALLAYGYLVDSTGENDAQTRFAVRAMQMHFRPDDYSGKLDTETAAILFSLLEKYRPGALRKVLRIASN
jgi:N-acetylmuramoyl-L-alanine amidase